MRERSLWRVLGCLGVVSFAVSAFTPLPNILDRWSRVPSDIRPAQAIVVLGSVVSADGILSCESLRRAIRGIVLQREGIAPLVVFSGGSTEGGAGEAEVRAKLAQTLGVPSEAVLTETRALTTREEAVRIGRTLRERQVTRILLVTDSLHMPRARALFERVGLRVQPANVDSLYDIEESPEGRLRLMRAVLGEWLALTYYRVAGYL